MILRNKKLMVLMIIIIATVGYFMYTGVGYVNGGEKDKPKKYSQTLFQKMKTYRKSIKRNNEIDAQALQIITALERKKYIYERTKKVKPYSKIVNKIQEVDRKKGKFSQGDFTKLEKVYLAEAILDWNVHQLFVQKGSKYKDQTIQKKFKKLNFLQLKIDIERKIKNFKNFGIRLREDTGVKYRVVYKNVKNKLREIIQGIYNGVDRKLWWGRLKQKPEVYKTDNKDAQYFIKKIEQGSLDYSEKKLLVKRTMKKFLEEFLEKKGIKYTSEIDKLMDKLDLSKSETILNSKYLTSGILYGIISDLEVLKSKLEKFKKRVSKKSNVKVEAKSLIG